MSPDRRQGLSHEVEKYTGDMRDERWERLHPLLTLERNGPGRPLELNMRVVVDSIFYVLRTGCPSAIRHQSVYYHCAKWRDAPRAP
jgi:hypothetical protein